MRGGIEKRLGGFWQYFFIGLDIEQQFKELLLGWEKKLKFVRCQLHRWLNLPPPPASPHERAGRAE